MKGGTWAAVSGHRTTRTPATSSSTSCSATSRPIGAPHWSPTSCVARPVAGPTTRSRGGVAELLPAVPAAQPPLGFDERVLARLAADAQGRGASPETGSSSRRRWVVVAAAILVAVLIPAGLWLASGSDEGRVRRRRRDDAPPDARSRPVGTVSVTDVAGEPAIVVAILDAPEGVSYFCRARLGDGTVVDSEAWPAGVGAWVVPLPSADVDAVDVLPVGTDIIWAAASFR